MIREVVGGQGRPPHREKRWKSRLERLTLPLLRGSWVPCLRTRKHVPRPRPVAKTCLRVRKHGTQSFMIRRTVRLSKHVGRYPAPGPRRDAMRPPWKGGGRRAPASAASPPPFQGGSPPSRWTDPGAGYRPWLWTPAPPGRRREHGGRHWSSVGMHDNFRGGTSRTRPVPPRPDRSVGRVPPVALGNAHPCHPPTWTRRTARFPGGRLFTNRGTKSVKAEPPGRIRGICDRRITTYVKSGAQGLD